MNATVKMRFLILVAGIALMGLAVGGLTFASQGRAAKLRQQLGQVDSESFRIAAQFADDVRVLNMSLYRYGAGHDAADLRWFDKTSHELDRWIDQQKPKLLTAAEQSLMQQIDTAYDKYLAVARVLVTRLESLGQQSATLAEYAGLMRESDNLSQLGQALAQAHYQSRSGLVRQANETIGQLRTLVLVSLGGLFLLGAILAFGVYRNLIAPLRMKLVESQSLLERREKLASLGVLAAGVAHEIRNPLTAIKAALFIQQKQFQPGSREHADSQLVEREILRLERIVNEFLQFARPTEPRLAEVDAVALLREVGTLLTPQLARHNIQLTVADAPAFHVHADAAQIKQVLINLIQNAADAIGENGAVRLTVRAERKRLGGREQAAAVLEVSDNGKGMSPEVQHRLFDPFFTTKETGTGLGLSIAAGIIEKHGGALQYQSWPGRGTTFGIVLPQATA